MTLCGHCDEPIEPNDRVQHYPICGGNGAIHIECFWRLLFGGLNHLRRTCACYGGTEPPDPPEMTRREAAIAAQEERERTKVGVHLARDGGVLLRRSS